MADNIFTDENFDADVLQSGVPTLVDFWAPWCGPCRFHGPIVEELARDYAAKPVKIGKLNVDEAPKTAMRFGIMGIPTSVIFKNGQIAATFVGVQDKATLAKKLDELMA